MTVTQSTDIHNLHYLSYHEDKEKNVHRYILDGDRVPGGSTFTKGGYPTSEGLISWQKGQTAESMFQLITEKGADGFYPRRDIWPVKATRVRELIKESKAKDKETAEKAADIGTIVHDYSYHSELNHIAETEAIIKSANAHPDWEKIERGISKFLDWKRENPEQPRLSETIVASVLHQFGGKFDRLSQDLILDDFKTSNAIYIDHFNQLGAYAIALEEWLGITVRGLRVLRFGKETGEFQPLLIDKPEEIQAFKMQAILCRQTYKFKLKWEADKRFKWGGKK